MQINEKTRILSALKAVRGDVAQAAAQCGVSSDQVASVRRWYEEDCCRASVFYQAGARLELEREVLPVENGDGPEADSLPLFARHTPRIRFHGKVYPTDAPGLYRFVWDPEYQRNVIVVQDDHDVLTPLEGLANLHIHGNRDQDETFKEDFQRRFQTQPWVSATCGGIARSARLMLREAGLSVRQVGTLTMGKLNLYNNGHWMIEVRNPADGRWILADPDAGFLFRDGKNWLNLVEFNRRIVRNEPPEFFALSRKTCDPFFMLGRCADGFNLSFLVRWKLRNTASLWEWYRGAARIAGVFDERDEMMVYFGDADAIRAVHGKTILVLTEAEWAERYYDGQVPSATANSTRPGADKINRE